ncbi:sensor histidine kinase [Sphingomonas glacialis]|uniref:Histidine kinase domain-containing protein n=1 Tax=Sphingomonas glacialis TaxID=658225 RepID=A0A502FU49_9SPHN|nr:sensor histidine kinase [Sphingomonas glacialis]TPG52626.1 hypothetical protein EAH76_12095 [Sphingomonas glacialis]
MLVSILACVLYTTPALSLDPALSIAQYKHTRWTIEDGAPSTIGALAQGRDGYLWIGAAAGVFRFDGVSFEQIAAAGPTPPHGAVSALLAAHDGSIWVGYTKGGLSVVQHGLLHDIPAPPFTDYVISLTQGPDHAIWAVLGRPDMPLLRFDGHAWLQIGENWGLPHQQVTGLLQDREGALWVATEQLLMILRPGSRHFEKVPVTLEGHAALSEDSRGRIWASDNSGSWIVSPRDQSRRHFKTPAFPRAAWARFDHDDNLWGLYFKKGIFRLSAPLSPRRALVGGAPPLDVDVVGSELASSAAGAVFEDREGNIWIGSSRGLDRFRAANVIVQPQLRDAAVFGDVITGVSSGAVYVGEADTIYEILPGGGPMPVISHVGSTEAICEGLNGDVWMFTHERLLRLRDKHLLNTTHPISVANGAIDDCLVDDQGVLWANAGTDGLFRLAGGKWDHPVIPSAGGFRPVQLIPTADHRRLAYLASGAIVEFDGGGHAIREELKPTAGRAMSMAIAGASGLLVGDPSGLGRVWHGSLQTISATRVPWVRQPTGVVQTKSGQTWMIAQAQIIGLVTSELEAAFTDRKARLRPVVLSFSDGLPDIDVRSGVRAAALGGDGRVWFSTLAGTVFVDPAHLVRNTLPPPVSINRLVTPRNSYTDPVYVDLPQGTSKVEIGYAALSLTMPERVRVRYRLEGVDDDWVDPGSRREASYSNLAPGRYRFHVIAANNDGVWNRSGATVGFSIAPTFLQSGWFTLLCTMAGALLLWALYSVRTRQLTARVRDRLGAQLAERERIARELHDTLLQGFQGLVLRFQAIANRLPPDSAMRPPMDEALNHAEAVLTEGRNRVSDLRFAEDGPDLAGAIVAIAGDLGSGSAASITVTAEGRARELDAMVREELLRIAEEAIRNAIQHSKASRIEVTIVYGRQLQLGVRDDGKGLPDDVAAAGQRPRHFGLTGMRERARHAGGLLTIASRPQLGVEVSVAVPGRLAYAPGQSLNARKRNGEESPT